MMCLNFVRAHWDEGELLCLISMTTNSDFVPVLNLMAQSERPDVTIKLKLGDNMFGFCHRKRGGHDCAEARSCGGEGCPISKEMLEAGLISLRRMKEGQKARIAHVQASGELGRRIRDMGLIPGAEVEVVGRAPLRDPVALRLPGFTLSLRNNEADYIVVEPLEQAG